jgi:hypothetical protein
MADNRMYLRCKGCGAEMMLAKMGGNWMDWFFVKTDEAKGRELSEFLDAHSHCCDDVDPNLLDWDWKDWQDARPFELVYENDDDWRKKKSLKQLTDESHI